MPRLTNLEISKDEFIFMKSKAVKGGSEGNILFFKEGSLSVVRKIFKDNFGYPTLPLNLVETIRKNKLEKLKILKNKNFEFGVPILKTISCEGKFVAYDTLYDEEMVSFSSFPLASSKYFEYWKVLEKAIIESHYSGIVLGDIQESNILINPKTKRIRFCDLDNMQVEGYNIDSYRNPLIPFIKEGGFIYPQIDIYMYNLLLLSKFDSKKRSQEEILEVLQSETLDYIKEDGYPLLKELAKAKNRRVYNGKFLTSYLK